MNKKVGPTEEFIQNHREQIGRTIKAFRERNGYSQDELADIMEVHRTTILKVETGKFAITVDYLVKFAWFLNFDINMMAKEKV